jgi:general stress protein YciG
MEPPTKKQCGFALMSAEKRREIASKGGMSVPPEKRAYAMDHDLAKSAGGAGGRAKQLARALVPSPDVD